MTGLNGVPVPEFPLGDISDEDIVTMIGEYEIRLRSMAKMVHQLQEVISAMQERIACLEEHEADTEVPQ